MPVKPVQTCTLFACQHTQLTHPVGCPALLCSRCSFCSRPPPLSPCTLQLSKAVEKAIRTSPLSLNPTTEGSEVLVQLPRMTQDNINRLIKLVHMEAEGAHQSIRRARQKGMDAVKKAFKSASQDEKKRQEKEVGGRGRGLGVNVLRGCDACLGVFVRLFPRLAALFEPGQRSNHTCLQSVVPMPAAFGVLWCCLCMCRFRSCTTPTWLRSKS